MSLTLYKKKRNFRNTPEPRLNGKSRKSLLHFVVQKHAASHLHYDFRLEMDGRLKSWAVPKGPSMIAGEKRLAVMVEDHPLSYGKFSGIIPKGNYGAGIVEIWDNGTYQPVDDFKDNEAEKILYAQFKKGNLKFILDGHYLKGEFALVQMQGQEKNWLLIKKADLHAVKDFNIDEVKPVRSVSGNGYAPSSSMENKNEPAAPTETLEQAWKNLQHPMLAKLISEIQNRKDWLYEIKYDGYRAIAKIDNGKIEMISRNGNSFAGQYPSLIKELEKIKAAVILDGEVVIENSKGISDFQLLQNYSTTHKGTLKYYVFDILFINGHRITDLPLQKRKELLDTFFHNYKFTCIIRSDYKIGKGKELFKKLSGKGYEGIVAKDMNSAYLPGKRSDSWLKLKAVQSQEAVICGYTLPQKSRKYFGSLILGVYKGHTLLYIGNCGTGFTDASLKELHEKLEKLTSDKCPFDIIPAIQGSKGKVIWIRPVLVCQVKFHQWTKDNRLRVPVFMGLRIDKKPTETVAEKVIVKEKENDGRSNQEEMIVTAGNKKVKCTHPGKIYFPEDRITKGDVINYYRHISNYLLPYLKNRPLSLNRHPNGIHGQSFYQKDMQDEKLPAWVKTVKLYSKSNKKYINYLICNDEATLIYIANLGSIEINPWHSKYTTPEKPDYLMLDLDPGDIAFQKVVDTALTIKAICDELKVNCYCKTSGASGLHVYLPLEAKYAYAHARLFAELLANLVHKKLPQITSVERAVEKRSGKVYIDFLQNHKGQTIAAPYCLRPRPHATVSTPLRWNEVNHQLSPEMFTIQNIQQRLQEKGDLWKGILGKGIRLQTVLNRIGKLS
jgi:bifunctional non-homologous end joining protein LigD